MLELMLRWSAYGLVCYNSSHQYLLYTSGGADGDVHSCNSWQDH
jgi:hypothetical protein